MLRRLSILPVTVFILFLCGCKKDLLHLKKALQLNSNTPHKLNHVKFVDDKICIAAGGVQFEQSVVLRSEDGGYTWVASSYPDAPKEMFGMGTSPDGTMYLSGVDGDVLHSKDSGKTWQFHRIYNWYVYVGGMFPTPDTGIFVSTILQDRCSIIRVDSNFNIIDDYTQMFGANNIYMTGKDTGYVIGYGVVMKTVNRGNTWTFQDVKDDNFMAMDIHGEEIWMCGFNGSVYHTGNGGASWERRRNGNDITTPRYHMLSILFTDTQHGWASCDDGRVVHTDDGGRHWAEYDRFTHASLRSIALCPNGDLLMAGDNGALWRITP